MICSCGSSNEILDSFKVTTGLVLVEHCDSCSVFHVYKVTGDLVSIERNDISSGWDEFKKFKDKEVEHADVTVQTE